MLCKSCSRFCLEVGELLPSDFDLSGADAELSPLAERPDFDSMVSRSRWPLHEMVLYSSLVELKSANRRQCSICRCIAWSIPASEIDQLPDGSYRTILILVPGTGRPSLRIRLEEFSNPEEPVSIYLENIALYYQSLRDSDLLAATLNHCSNVQNDSTGSSGSFQLAKYWLDDCLQNHIECPKPRVGQLPTRLLDVQPSGRSQSIRLINSSTVLSTLPLQELTYVALSHCWGKEQIITTASHNLADRQSSIAMSDLTKTFHDAVLTTQSLGYRFLWIDSLCIIQDSVEDWKRESVQMCAIYQNAAVTIAAVHASNGNEGCFAQRDGLARLPFSMPFRNSRNQPKVTAFFVPLPNRGISDSRARRGEPLLRRAWVLQEQVLSRALLMFHDEELQWECHTKQQSEKSPDGAMLDRAYAYLSRTVAGNDDPFNPQDFDEGSKQLKTPTREIEQSSDMHREWCFLVIDYTWRGITNTMDRLIALDGIAQVISRRTSNRYLAGLWKDQLLTGLTWSIPWDHRRNNTFWDQAEDPTTSFVSSRHPTTLAPSWSWASVTFPVIWYFVGKENEAHGMKPLCDIIDANVAGTPFHMTGSINIKGLTRSLYVDPIYQRYHFSGKSKENPNIKDANIVDQKEPDEYPITPDTCRISLSRPGSPEDFVDFPITFSPDELLQRNEKITFLALAEVPASRFPSSVEGLTMPSVLTLALIPTDRNENEYRRVGLAEWHNCSWHGYFCLGNSYFHRPQTEFGLLWTTQWRQFTLRWSDRRLKTILKDILEQFSNWLVRIVCNQPFRQGPRGERLWFPHLANGRWGWHHHPASPSSLSYRAGWEPKLETITIV